MEKPYASLVLAFNSALSTLRRLGVWVQPLDGMLVHGRSVTAVLPPRPQDTLFGRTIPYSHMERAAAAAAKEKTVMVSCSKAQHNDPAASKTAQPGVQIKSQNNIKASKTRRL